MIFILVHVSLYILNIAIMCPVVNIKAQFIRSKLVMSQPVRPVCLVCVLGINNVVISQLFSCADERQVIELCNVITDVSQSVGVCISLSMLCS